MPQEHEHFCDIIADMPACMLVTADENELRSRPLAPFIDKQSRTIQFVTVSDSAKVEELLKHRKLCLTFADSKKCSLHPCKVAAESRKTENSSRNSGALIARPFFLDGRDSVAVITVEASLAEYWDNDKGNLSIAYEVAKAYFGDEGPDLGENAKLDL